MKIILGSQSKGRQYVLKQAGYDFEVMPADIDEKQIRSTNYEELPLLIAREKAKKLMESISEEVILITSDQIVVCDGELREKPENEEEAFRFLKSYGEFPARTIAGVVVTNTRTKKSAEGLDMTTTYFKPIPDEAIKQMIQEDLVMHGAGAFIFQDPLLQPYIDHYQGAIDSIIGLPLQLTERLIREVSV
jgi:septum formation protein